MKPNSGAERKIWTPAGSSMNPKFQGTTKYLDPSRRFDESHARHVPSTAFFFRPQACDEHVHQSQRKLELANRDHHDHKNLTPEFLFRHWELAKPHKATFATSFKFHHVADTDARE